jgi:hypothetical protein
MLSVTVRDGTGTRCSAGLLVLPRPGPCDWMRDPSNSIWSQNLLGAVACLSGPWPTYFWLISAPQSPQLHHRGSMGGLSIDRS